MTKNEALEPDYEDRRPLPLTSSDNCSTGLQAILVDRHRYARSVTNLCQWEPSCATHAQFTPAIPSWLTHCRRQSTLLGSLQSSRLEAHHLIVFPRSIYAPLSQSRRSVAVKGFNHRRVPTIQTTLAYRATLCSTSPRRRLCIAISMARAPSARQCSR